MNEAPSPHVEAGLDWRLSEFFVLRSQRRAGIGSIAARALFDRFHGAWEVRELARNEPAIRFWRRVIGEYCVGRFEERPLEGAPRQVFRSPGIGR